MFSNTYNYNSRFEGLGAYLIPPVQVCERFLLHACNSERK